MSIRRYALERNVAAASAAVFLIGLGEELWERFVPKYLEALGAGVTAVGLYGTTQDCFDALYQYPGGWLADRLGRRHAFMLFVLIAAAGYLVYLCSPAWPFLFLALALTMAWQSMASPGIFAVIGDALPQGRRAHGFTLQAILKRVPMVVSPLVGGACIARFGVVRGVHIGLAASLVLAALTLLVLRAIDVPRQAPDATRVAGVWRSFHGSLRRLLLSDIVIRTCEGLAGVFVVLYVTNITGASLVRYSVLVAVQTATSMLVYLPAARGADRLGRKPFVVASFACFALFPLAVVLAPSPAWLFGAFVVGGLREIGEPSRKAMIVDFAAPHLRGRTVGLYYLLRGLSVAPAAAIGGLLWRIAPNVPFVTACIVGLAGTLVFAATVEEAPVSKARE